MVADPTPSDPQLVVHGDQFEGGAPVREVNDQGGGLALAVAGKGG